MRFKAAVLAWSLARYVGHLQKSDCSSESFQAQQAHSHLWKNRLEVQMVMGEKLKLAQPDIARHSALDHIGKYINTEASCCQRQAPSDSMRIIFLPAWPT